VCSGFRILERDFAWQALVVYTSFACELHSLSSCVYFADGGIPFSFQASLALVLGDEDLSNV